MAAATGRKQRTTLENSAHRLSRNSTFMNSPNSTLCDNTPHGRKRNSLPLLFRRNQQPLVSRLSSCCQAVLLHRRLELQMQSQRRHNHRSPVTIVAGIVDVLHAKRRVNPAPQVKGVVTLDNVLATVIKAPIAQKKTQSTQREVSLMVSRDAIGNECQTRAVKFPAPPLATAANSNFYRPIHFGVGERFVPALVPSPTPKHAHPIIKGLFEIRPKSILDRRL